MADTYVVSCPLLTALSASLDRDATPVAYNLHIHSANLFLDIDLASHAPVFKGAKCDVINAVLSSQMLADRLGNSLLMQYRSHKSLSGVKGLRSGSTHLFYCGTVLKSDILVSNPYLITGILPSQRFTVSADKSVLPWVFSQATYWC